MKRQGYRIALAIAGQSHGLEPIFFPWQNYYTTRPVQCQ